MWQRLNALIWQFFNGVTLADLMAEQQEKESQSAAQNVSKL